jgi:hypothetical protein
MAGAVPSFGSRSREDGARLGRLCVIAGRMQEKGRN